MARVRTQKLISKRIDLNYFKGHHGLRTGRKVAMWGCFVVAILAVTFFSLGDSAGRLHNPGPVTASHAMWENDCAACHTGDGKGGFARGVADSACLKCHDAAVHSDKQIRFITTASMGGGAAAAAAGDPHHVTAANCTECHTEHRGHDALLGVRNDRTCTTCHADLTKDSQTPPVVQASVTAFNTADHPRFGRSITRGGKLVDPTVLKFNHKLHNGQKGLENNCTACHSTAAVPVAAHEMSGDNPPPWVTAKDRMTRAMNTHDLKSMEPISYERNCMGCHPISLPGGGPTLAHDKLEIVRAQLLSLPAMYAEKLANDPDREKKLVTEEKVGRPPRQKTIRKEITADQWVEDQLKTLESTMDKGAGSAPDYDAVKRVAGGSTTLPSIGGAVQGPNPAVAELFVVYGASNACVKCHEVTGSVPAIVYNTKSPAAAAAKSTSAPATKPTLLATVPTGIPSSPRRWFANANFDHDAHRSMRCLDCHAGALTSTDTADVLSPNIDTRLTYTLNGQQMHGQACVDCHKPSTATARGADTHCVACHQFHDRTKERAPDGALVGMPPLSEKAVATPANPEKDAKGDEKKG